MRAAGDSGAALKPAAVPALTPLTLSRARSKAQGSPPYTARKAILGSAPSVCVLVCLWHIKPSGMKY